MCSLSFALAPHRTSDGSASRRLGAGCELFYIGVPPAAGSSPVLWTRSRTNVSEREDPRKRLRGGRSFRGGLSRPYTFGRTPSNARSTIQDLDRCGSTVIAPALSAERTELSSPVQCCASPRGCVPAEPFYSPSEQLCVFVCFCERRRHYCSS